MKFEGIYTPVITPYRQDYAIDYERLAEVVDFLLAAGVHGIISAGTTGEYYAQSMRSVSRTSRTCMSQLLPTTVTTGVLAASRA
jgi:4-hydroxy-tetrahydrodipicolinate synthase